MSEVLLLLRRGANSWTARLHSHATGKDELTVVSLWLRTSQAEMVLGLTVRQISGQKLVMPGGQCRALSDLKRDGYVAMIMSTHLGASRGKRSTQELFLMVSNRMGEPGMTSGSRDEWRRISVP